MLRGTARAWLLFAVGVLAGGMSSACVAGGVHDAARSGDAAAADEPVGGSLLPDGAAATARDARLDQSAAGVLTDAPVFVDVALEAGLDHVQAPRGTTLGCEDYLPEKCPFTELHMSGGAATADVDGDGLADLFVTRIEAPSLLYRNRGDGTFEDITERAGLSGRTADNGAAFGDVDNDGDPDLYVTSLLDTRYRLYINEGDHFVEQAVQRGAAVETEFRHHGFSVAFGDYDVDGFLDIHTTEWFQTDAGRELPNHARLLHNRGAETPGFFEDVTEVAGVELFAGPRATRTSFASDFSDLDGDGLPELLVVADFQGSRLFWNRGDGSFDDGSWASGIGREQNGMGSALGDFDADGDIDWFVTSIYDPEDRCSESEDCGWGTTGNRLYENQGDRTFDDVTDDAGVRDGGWGWGAAFFDYDNDGDLDLVMTNGVDFPGPEPEPFRSDRMRLFRNDGQGTFVDVAAEAGLDVPDDGRGLLYFDYDNDGDLDLFVANHESSPRLFRNDGGNRNHWLRVALEGRVSNRQGVGAKVIATPTVGAPPLFRELRAGSHFLGQSEAVVHFGLGAQREPLAELRVRWPSGAESVIRDAPLDRTLVVRE